MASVRLLVSLEGIYLRVFSKNAVDIDAFDSRLYILELS